MDDFGEYEYLEEMVEDPEPGEARETVTGGDGAVKSEEKEPGEARETVAGWWWLFVSVVGFLLLLCWIFMLFGLLCRGGSLSPLSAFCYCCVGLFCCLACCVAVEGDDFSAVWPAVSWWRVFRRFDVSVN